MRLATLWVQGDLAAFYGRVQEELAPKVVRSLRGKFGLTLEDCEDCFSQALEGLVERQDGDRGPIANPQAYVWQSAKNAAMDLLRDRVRESQVTEGAGPDLRVPSAGRRKRAIKAEPSGEGNTYTGDSVPIPERSAVFLIEGLMEEVDAEAPWAVAVVETALSRLPPALRRVAQHLLIYGPDYNAAQAPADLGMSSNTFRANKSKAYKELRGLIPAVMQEKGIPPREHGIPEVGLPEARPFPSEEEHDQDGT